MRTHDAIIIGGGPAGASAATFLARGGWRVAVIERAAFPRRKVCGEFISATSRPTLEALGVAEAWQALAGPPVRRVGLFAGEHEAEAAMPDGGDGFGRALGRETLDVLLLDAARKAGAEVFQPWRALSLQRRDGGFACHIQGDGSERELTAPVAIAAHGSWEPGPLPTQLPRVRTPADLLAFKAHFTGAALPDGLMPLLAFPGGYGGMVACDGGRVSLSCCIRRDALADLRHDADGAGAGEAVLGHIRRHVRAVDRVLDAAALAGPWLASGPIRPQIRVDAADGALRAGNIAGESHPVVAEGVSMALQGGGMLGQILIEAGREAPDLEAVRRRYAARWKAQFGGRIAAARLLAALAARPAGAAAMATLADRFPALLTLGARLSGKTRPLRLAA